MAAGGGIQLASESAYAGWRGFSCRNCRYCSWRIGSVAARKASAAGTRETGLRLPETTGAGGASGRASEPHADHLYEIREQVNAQQLAHGGFKTMLKFSIHIKVKENIRAKCPRHPHFDPSVDLRLNSDPGCSTCSDLRALQAARVKLEEACKAFDRRAYQWRATHLVKQTRSSDDPI